MSDYNLSVAASIYSPVYHVYTSHKSETSSAAVDFENEMYDDVIIHDVNLGMCPSSVTSSPCVAASPSRNISPPIFEFPPISPTSPPLITLLQNLFFLFSLLHLC